MQLTLLSVMVLASASLHLRAEYAGPKRYVYVFKPLTILLIGCVVILAPSPDPVYQSAILAGLFFSLLGDICLMLPSDRFLAGLSSFFAAHVAYIVAFTLPTGFITNVLPLLPYLLGAMFVYGLLRRHLGGLAIPVVLYMVVIAVMGWQALGRWVTFGGTDALLAMLGATLFVISDAALALNRFVKPFRSAQAVVMTTYFAAQWLIALSV